jgi:hypothetical protein
MTHVRITGECRFEVVEFRLRKGMLGGVIVAWGEGTLFGDRALLVASRSDSGEMRTSISSSEITITFPPAVPSD